MKLQKGEEIILKKTPVISYFSQPLIFNDSDSPIQANTGVRGFMDFYLTNKRLLLEVSLLHMLIFDLPIKEIKKAFVRKDFLTTRLIVDSKVFIEHELPSDSLGVLVSIFNSIMRSTFLKPSRRVWIALGKDSYVWSEKINNMIKKK